MNKLLACESKRLRSFQLLPASLKKLGFILLAISLLSLILLVFIEQELPFLENVVKSGFLLSMLLISITKEKEEDEYTLRLRGRPYVLAFVIGVLYAIFQPYINYFVAAIVRPEKADFAELSSFAIIWFMLFIQLGFYYLLRYTR